MEKLLKQVLRTAMEQEAFNKNELKRVTVDTTVQRLQDKGYQGIQKLHTNSCLSIKKPGGGQLSAQDKTYNRSLARKRVVIEQVNRC